MVVQRARVLNIADERLFERVRTILEEYPTFTVGLYTIDGVWVSYIYLKGEQFKFGAYAVRSSEFRLAEMLLKQHRIICQPITYHNRGKQYYSGLTIKVEDQR